VIFVSRTLKHSNANTNGFDRKTTRLQAALTPGDTSKDLRCEVRQRVYLKRYNYCVHLKRPGNSTYLSITLARNTGPRQNEPNAAINASKIMAMAARICSFSSDPIFPIMKTLASTSNRCDSYQGMARCKDENTCDHDKLVEVR